MQSLKKEVSDDVDFLITDKHEGLLKINAMILMGMVKSSQSFQNSKFAMSSGVILLTEGSTKKALFH